MPGCGDGWRSSKPCKGLIDRLSGPGIAQTGSKTHEIMPIRILAGGPMVPGDPGGYTPNVVTGGPIITNTVTPTGGGGVSTGGSVSPFPDRPRRPNVITGGPINTDPLLPTGGGTGSTGGSVGSMPDRPRRDRPYRPTPVDPNVSPIDPNLNIIDPVNSSAGGVVGDGSSIVVPE